MLTPFLVPLLLAAPAEEGFIERSAATYDFRLGAPRAITITPDGGAVLFLRAGGPRSFVQDLWLFDVKTGEERVLLTAEKVLAGAAEQLTEAEKAQRERRREAAKGITGYQLSKDGRLVLLPLGGRLYVVERATGRVEAFDSPAGRPFDPTFSPDGRRLAAVRGADLYVVDRATKEELRLTESREETVTHAQADFVAAEEMGRGRGYWWSPDSKAIAYTRVDEAPVEKLWRFDATTPEQPPREARFPRAGTKNAETRLFVVGVDGKGRREVRWDRARFPYLARVTWSKHGPLTIVVQDRRQQTQRVLAADAKGATRTLLEERDAAWLNLDDGAMPRWREGGTFLWSSERSGSWALYEHDARGEALRVLVPPELGYRRLLRVERDAVWVSASADPLDSHVWRVPTSGPPRALTSGRGMHGAVVGRRGDTWVHTFGGLDGARYAEVHRGDGVAGRLRDVSEAPPLQPNVQLFTVEVAGRTHHVALLLPRGWAGKGRLPVVLSVYGGPHVQVVTSAGRRYLRDQWLADKGFAVLRADGRGTPNRGRAWERAVRLNLGEVPLEDQVAVLRAVGALRPELDLEQVGVFGWSFGGYLAALAVLRRPDVFKVGVAGAPVADWRDYDTHYTERYMGLPDENRAGYDDASALTWAARADLPQRPLLVVHGTVDDNVYFTHAVKLSDALLRAGKRHEVLPLSGLTHMVPDPVVARNLQERLAGFLVEHLNP